MRLRQVVLAAGDLDAAVADLAAVFGAQVAYRDPAVAEFGVRNALMPVGDQFLEVISPTRPGTAAGRLLERRGDSGYMVIVQTDDFARERTRLDRLGVRIVWEASHDDIRAAHLHPKDIGGAIVSIDQPTPPASWRWAGPDWTRYPAAYVRRVLGVELEAHDPRAMAQRWAEVLAREGPVSHGRGWRVTLDDDQAIDFVPAGSRGEGVSAFTLAADVPAVRARAAVRGLPVAEATVTACGTRFRLV